jgi:hypothetical protein
MRTPKMLVGLLPFLLNAAAGVSAQEFTVAVERGDVIRSVGIGAIGPMQGPDIDVIAIEPFHFGPPVKDAPYSAEAVTETTQVLADGNRIERRTSATIARDSSGRIRRQQQAMVFGGLVAKSQGPLVTISDPSGTHITLDPDRRVAYRMKTPPLPLRGEFEMAVPAAGGGPAKRGRLRVNIGGAPPPIGPADGPAGTDLRTEQLEPREIEGVRAEGTRTTMTIEANAIGNHMPIVIVSERWYSPELQVVVLTRRSDPRFGETVYKLVNIVRGEPSPDLFEVPSDYRMEEHPVGPGARVKPPA